MSGWPALSERLLTNFYARDQMAAIKKAQGRRKLATVELRKEPSDSWRTIAENQVPTTMAVVANYTLPTILPTGNGCTDDTWTATSTTNAPVGRSLHTAVWTGSEMIIWGGWDGFNYVNTGGRYSPSTDTWTTTSTANAPSARENYTAVWTGSEMIIWGGYVPSINARVNTGGRYNPITDSWTATSTTNAPVGRFLHTAVWSGSEMIVWGGEGDFGDLNTGGRYNPITNSWTPTSTTNAPAPREMPTAVWSGSEMIVWGGFVDGGDSTSGGRYNPSTDSWIATSTTNAPLPRDSYTAVWSGSEMIVWGGFLQFNGGLGFTNTGGRYNPITDSWTATSTTNAPLPRDSHTAVWSGSEMIVWGGAGNFSELNTGGRYNPSADSWIATSTTNAPEPRITHTAIWSGSEMIVWGGEASATFFNTGGRYCAQTAPVPQSAFSRKTHGAAGTFDIPLPLAGNVGIECRTGGATNDYQMIINFASSVTVESASVTSGTGSVSSFTVSGPQVAVNLTGVTNIQRITLTLFNVNDGTHMGNVPVSMGVLIGDVNGNSVVNASDVALTKSQVGQPVTMSNFREDVNVSRARLVPRMSPSSKSGHVGTSLPP